MTKVMNDYQFRLGIIESIIKFFESVEGRSNKAHYTYYQSFQSDLMEIVINDHYDTLKNNFSKIVVGDYSEYLLYTSNRIIHVSKPKYNIQYVDKGDAIIFILLESAYTMELFYHYRFIEGGSDNVYESKDFLPMDLLYSKNALEYFKKRLTNARNDSNILNSQMIENQKKHISYLESENGTKVVDSMFKM